MDIFPTKCGIVRLEQKQRAWSEHLLVASPVLPKLEVAGRRAGGGTFDRCIINFH